MARDLKQGQQVRVRLQWRPLPHTVRLMQVVPNDDINNDDDDDDGEQTNRLPLAEGDRLASNKWVYSRYPVELGISTSYMHWFMLRFGYSLNFTFEVIDLPGDSQRL
ncbi:uncharacterized protein LOC101847810 [Aplysia californica]|uniref:Uncharacterized protein LOC101847810 n=1 Tax=Aplysia californica TaxID=6500 RepID=A0ABM0JJF4_APLCA|nr:uncharacterized protein LOC101847810 [Aplysia californica]